MMIRQSVNNLSQRSGSFFDVAVKQPEISEQPIFSLKRLEWSMLSNALSSSGAAMNGGLRRASATTSSSTTTSAAASKAQFKRMAAAANTIALGCQDRCSILRFNLDAESPEDIEVLPSRKQEDSVQHLFLDPTGHHLIICLQNGDNYYLHSRSTRPKKLSRLQGNVECLAFDRQSGTETVTKSFLVGTSTGFIYEMSLESGGKERTCQLIHQLDQPISITSIYFEVITNNDKATTLGDNLTPNHLTASTSLSSSSAGSYTAGDSSASTTLSAAAAAVSMSASASATALLGGVMSAAVAGPFGGGGSYAEKGDSNLGSDERSTKLFVMFSTTSPTRLYFFLGSGSFKDIFVASNSSFTELPGGISRAELHCFNKYTHTRAQSFALMTAMGIYHGSIVFSPSSTSKGNGGGIGAAGTDETVQMVEALLMPYLNTATVTLSQQSSNVGVMNGGGGGGTDGLVDGVGVGDMFLTPSLPLSIAATEFHFLVLTHDRLQIVSRLNGSVEQDDDVLRFIEGTPLGLLRDPSKGNLWLYTSCAVYQIVCINESRRVWSIYLEKALLNGGDEKLFDKSLEFCQKKEEEEFVSRARAEYCLSQLKLEQAALCYSKANLPFDEVVLRLLRATSASMVSPLADSMAHQSIEGDSISQALSRLVVPPIQTQSLSLSQSQGLSALRVYLQEQLVTLPYHSKSQRTMLCTWLCEIFLHQITANVLAPGGSDMGADVSTSNNLSALIGQFKDFLRFNKSSLDQATTFSLLNSRGTPIHRTLALFFAQIVGNYELVISRYLSDGRFADAISILADAPFEKVEAIIYKSAPVLIENEPEACVNMLLAQSRLKASNLLPALLRYSTLLDKFSTSTVPSNLETDFEGNKVNFAIRYLQSIVERAESGGYMCESVVYHTLVWFLAKYDVVTEEGLLAFLQPQFDRLMEDYRDGLGGGSNPVLLCDLDHVLRQCKRYGRKKSTVLALMMTGLEDEAVEMALSLDVSLAKTLANKVRSDSHKRKLWLKIAIHTIKSEQNPASCLQLLEESQGILRIDDLLQHLPDFTDVDLLQEHICRTLENYGEKIDTLKAEMSELSESAESINRELESMTKRGYSYSTIQRCEDCSEALFNKQFYLFPCSHGFHSLCIMKRIKKSADENTLTKIRSLEEQIAIAAVRAKDVADKRAAVQFEYLQSELDNYCAADCPLCGYAMIDSLAIPLIQPHEIDEVQRWAL